MKREFEIEMNDGQIVHLTEEELLGIIAKAVRKALWGDEDKRLVIFSYDVTQIFKEHYKEMYGQDFSTDELWREINNLPSVEIMGKPVLSTLLLEVEDSSFYEDVVRLVDKKFNDLPYVIGVVERREGDDLYDINPNPDSEDDNV